MISVSVHKKEGARFYPQVTRLSGSFYTLRIAETPDAVMATTLFFDSFNDLRRFLYQAVDDLHAVEEEWIEREENGEVS